MIIDKHCQSLIARAKRAPRLTPPEERRYIEAWRARRDRRAAERLIEANQRHVVFTALEYRRYGTPLDDLISEGNVGLMKALERFERRSSLATFTYGIVYRTLIDHQRWYRRFSRRFAAEAAEEPEDFAFPRNSESDLRELERARRLYAALDKLPAEKRAALILHDLEGLDVADVAAISGANELTVRSRLRDAHKKLAELLRQDPLFDPEVPA